MLFIYLQQYNNVYMVRYIQHYNMSIIMLHTILTDYRQQQDKEELKKMSETKCRFNCGAAIHFDKKIVSGSGKLIPLEFDGNKHNCPNNP